MHRRRLIRQAAMVCFSTVAAPLLYGEPPSRKAIYRGGTLSYLEPPVKGEVSADQPDEFLFDYRAGVVEVPYDQVNLLEYGQKAGRRLGLSILVSPLFLLSKKHRHYLTIGFETAGGEQQAIVLELGKKIVRSTLAGLEARTGLRVEYENEAARQAARQ